ncbi:MAG: Ig-like domain-containing protein [Flavobacteriaceae bacterium]|nr:Ig-like domain-containing protein [Flavobacteriaceae bacterium]
MSKRSLRAILLFVLVVLGLTQCARRGTPDGGPRDLDPPVMTKAIPDTFSTNFDAEKIRIYFNEYVRLTNVQRQLIISPPMNFFPEIRPQGLPTNFIDILMVDTLKENTTYTFNFGQSIQDNNESNPLSFFKYVFSTGDYIDSLQISGAIKDALLEVPDNFISVMLQEVDSTFNDSTIYKQKPIYITNTLDSLTVFQMENIKPGTYFLYALKDINNNYLYDQKTEKIAFREAFVTLPTDSVFVLNLFKEINNFKAYRPTQAARRRYLFGYEGAPENIKIELLNQVSDSFDYRITKQSEKDTLFYWFKNYEADTLQFKVYQNDAKADTFDVSFKKIKGDTLLLKPLYTTFLPLDKPYVLTSEVPLLAFDENKISVLDQDSVVVNFKADLKNEQELVVDFPKTEVNRYKIQFLPGAVTDFFDRQNDTIRVTARTKSDREYGRLSLNLELVRDFPVVVQLLNSSGKVITEKIATTRRTVDFTLLDPMVYTIRIIHDTNANGKWDTGDFFKRRQPEQIDYMNKTIDIRANWDVFETFTPK